MNRDFYLLIDLEIAKCCTSVRTCCGLNVRGSKREGLEEWEKQREEGLLRFFIFLRGAIERFQGCCCVANLQNIQFDCAINKAMVSLGGCGGLRQQRHTHTNTHTRTANWTCVELIQL